MPLILQRWIKREHLRANPRVLYVFGDNVQRRGLRGQAKAMRGEPNAVGVATKYRPSLEIDAYFSDDDPAYLRQCAIIDRDMAPLFDHLRRGGTVVWPSQGIGSGLSDLAGVAPRTLAYLELRLKDLRAVEVSDLAE